MSCFAVAVASMPGVRRMRENRTRDAQTTMSVVHTRENLKLQIGTLYTQPLPRVHISFKARRDEKPKKKKNNNLKQKQKLLAKPSGREQLPSKVG